MAAIGIGMVALTDAGPLAGLAPLQFAQAAESGHAHPHPAESSGSGHQHDVGAHRHDGAAADASVQVELRTKPQKLEAGTRSELVFALSDAFGEPVDKLVTHHGRKLHVVLVSDDMQVLGHIHPQDFGEAVERGSAKTFFTFPQAGRYLVAVDFLTEAHGPQDKQFIVEVAGAPDGNAPEGEDRPGTVSVELEEDDRYTEAAVLRAADDKGLGYSVSLQQPDAIKAGEEASFAYSFHKDGQPVADLRPYLDAPMHLAVVKDDLTAFLHTHGIVSADAHSAHGDHGSPHGSHGSVAALPEEFGPGVAATITFPEPGTYHLFGQAAHGETLVISRFPVHVE